MTRWKPVPDVFRPALLAACLSAVALAACGGGGSGATAAAAGSSGSSGSGGSGGGGSTPSGPQTLTVTNSGGGGTVTSAPAGISCGSSCSGSFAAGTSVTLTATADTGYYFAGWTGACSGAGTCTLAMNAAETAQSTFYAGALGANCLQTASSTVFTVVNGVGNGYAFTRYGNYVVQLDDWGNIGGTLTQWMNSPTCWGTSTTITAEQNNLPASPEVTRGWSANDGALQAGSTSGYPNNPNWTTLSGLGLQVSSISKVHVKWAMTVPTTQNTNDSVSRWDALLDIYFHNASQGAPNPPSSAWPPIVDLQIYQMLMDQPLTGQPANLSSYWGGAFLNPGHPFQKTFNGVTYVGVIDGQTFNASGGHTISLFVEPTEYTNSSTTALLWGQNSVVHDVGGIIAWLSSSNPKDDSGNPIMYYNGTTVTSPVINPAWYLTSLNGGFELDFGSAGNNQWTTTDFWVAVQNEADGN